MVKNNNVKNRIQTRGTKAKGQDLQPPAETPIPRRSPRRPGKTSTTVSNQKRVQLKFDDSLLAKKGVDEDTAVLSTKKARVTSETPTVGKDTTAPEPSTQSFEQILGFIASTPEFDAILRKKYRPVMHSTPPGGKSRSLFLVDGWNDFPQSPEPEPESMSVASSDGPPSGSNDIELQDESDGDEPMDMSEGVSLYSSKARSKPGSENEKPLGRKRFTFAEPMSDEEK